MWSASYNYRSRSWARENVGNKLDLTCSSRDTCLTGQIRRRRTSLLESYRNFRGIAWTSPSKGCLQSHQPGGAARNQGREHWVSVVYLVFLVFFFQPSVAYMSPGKIFLEIWARIWTRLDCARNHADCSELIARTNRLYNCRTRWRRLGNCSSAHKSFKQR